LQADLLSESIKRCCKMSHTVKQLVASMVRRTLTVYASNRETPGKYTVT